MPSVFPLLTASLIGLAVGVEREWSGHSTGPDARFAGLRTFTLLGALGGFAGYMWQNGFVVFATCVITGAIAMPIVAYASTVSRPGTTADGTTEVAAILVATLGLIAGLGQDTLASGAGAVMVFLLAEKSALHRALQTIDAAELRATLLFAVMALVVLPLLPSGQFGPYGAIVPRQLWTVVLLFSALNFAGYIARRLVGRAADWDSPGCWADSSPPPPSPSPSAGAADRIRRSRARWPSASSPPAPCCSRVSR